MYRNYWVHEIKRDPLKFILPVASWIWAIYCTYRLAYAITVLEAVKFGAFGIMAALGRSKK